MGVNQSDAFRFVSVIAAGNRSAPGRFRPLAASHQVVQFVCLSKLPAALLKAPYWAKLALPFVLAPVTLRKLRPSLTLFATLFVF